MATKMTTTNEVAKEAGDKKPGLENIRPSFPSSQGSRLFQVGIKLSENRESLYILIHQTTAPCGGHGNKDLHKR